MQRSVWAHILTTRGWILGAVRTPARRSALRHLNGPGRFLHLTEAATGWWRPGAGPISIHKNHVLVFVPQAEERVAPSPARGRGVVHELTMLLAEGQLTGQFEVGRGVSPVVFLERSDRFVVLERCRLALPRNRLLRSGTVRFAIVNAQRVVGVHSRPVPVD
jgi:hypothetical protein